MKQPLKQKTIGLNPLEDYLSGAYVPEQPSEPDKSPEQASSIHSPEAEIKKQRVTLHISVDLLDRIKNAVYWEPGLTLAGFAEDALAAALEKLEYDRGAPFPHRKTHKLKTGRPIK